MAEVAQTGVEAIRDRCQRTTRPSKSVPEPWLSGRPHFSGTFIRCARRVQAPRRRPSGTIYAVPEPTLKIHKGHGIPSTRSADVLASAIEPLLDRSAPPAQRLNVTVVVAVDFGAAVEDANRIGGHYFGPFKPNRLGGDVKGKTVPISADHREARVIIDATWWNSETTRDAHRVGLLAHELFHPRLNRLRVEAGSAEHLAQTMNTPAGGARWSVRNAVDELRCDLAADSALKQAFTVETPVGVRPLPLGLLNSDDANYLGATLDAFDGLHDEWFPLLGQTITGVEQSLVARQTGSLLALLAHAEAEARSFDLPGVFAIPQIAEHPMGNLLHPAWQQICAAYDQYADRTSIAASDTAIADAGQEAVLNLWRRFGF